MEKNKIILHVVFWVLINVGYYIFDNDAHVITTALTTAFGYASGLYVVALIKGD